MITVDDGRILSTALVVASTRGTLAVGLAVVVAVILNSCVRIIEDGEMTEGLRIIHAAAPLTHDEKLEMDNRTVTTSTAPLRGALRLRTIVVRGNGNVLFYCNNRCVPRVCQALVQTNTWYIQYL